MAQAVIRIEAHLRLTLAHLHPQTTLQWVDTQQSGSEASRIRHEPASSAARFSLTASKSAEKIGLERVFHTQDRIVFSRRA
jgi:hypothetical protein